MSQPLLSSPCCSACYKDQISWFIVLPPTGHHPHSSSVQSCTSCSKEENTILCLLFINFSHIYKHTHRIRGWFLNIKQHSRECCYFSWSKFLWMRLNPAIFHQVTNFWRCRSCLPCLLNLLTFCLLTKQLLYAWKVLFITCLRRELAPRFCKAQIPLRVRCWKSKPQSLELLCYNEVKLVHSRSDPKFQYQCPNVNKKSIADK